MRILKVLTLIIGISLFTFACGSSGGGSGGGTNDSNNNIPMTTVVGTVLDINNAPIEGAQVTISSVPVTVTTDKNGNFSAGIEVGVHSIVIKTASSVIYSGTFICNESTPFSLGSFNTLYNPNGNSGPLANAGPDQNVDTGSLVQLDGSRSIDSDGDTLTYSWSFNSKPSGSIAELSDSTIVNPTFIADVDGTYEIQLVVNDGTVDSSSDTVIIIASTDPCEEADELITKYGIGKIQNIVYPSHVNPGEDIPFTITAKNTGDLPWGTWHSFGIHVFWTNNQIYRYSTYSFYDAIGRRIQLEIGEERTFAIDYSPHQEFISNPALEIQVGSITSCHRGTCRFIPYDKMDIAVCIREEP